MVGAFGGVLNVITAWGDDVSLLRLLATLPLAVATGALLLLVVGALTTPLMLARRTRFAAALLHGLAAAALAATLATSVLLRQTTGAYLTLGAIDFALAAERHVIGVALGPFAGLTLSLVMGALAIVALATWLALSQRGPAWRERLGKIALFGAPSAIIAGTLPPMALPGLGAVSPELALVTSFDEGSELMAPPGPPSEKNAGSPSAERGPHLDRAASWRTELARSDGQRPNVLVLTLESVALKHLGYAGYKRDTSPNIDRIAQHSLRMRRAWTTATHSNYAQMAILSSLFPRRGSGLDVYQRVDYPRVLLHDVFHELGYDTATVSSQDENWQGMRRFQDTGTPTHYFHSPDFHGQHVDTGAELVIPDAATVDHALAWLRARHGRRFALYMNLQATHFPYKLPPDAAEPFQPTGPLRGDFSYVAWAPEDRELVVNRYDNALRYVDEQVGRLARGLEQLGLLDDTLWVITSDHGELFGEHDLVTHGRTLFETEARVPLLVHWPKRVRSADVYEPVSHIDILPTILDLMGVAPHPAFQGKSFAAPRSEETAARGIYLNIQGLRSADALICWPWKLLADRSARKVMLFQLERDPDETEDRAGRDVRIASDMFRTLRAQMTAQVAYHKPKSSERTRRFAPRMIACPPGLPDTPRAEAVPTPAREPTHLPSKGEIKPEARDRNN